MGVPIKLYWQSRCCLELQIADSRSRMISSLGPRHVCRDVEQPGVPADIHSLSFQGSQDMCQPQQKPRGTKAKLVRTLDPLSPPYPPVGSRMGTELKLKHEEEALVFLELLNTRLPTPGTRDSWTPTLQEPVFLVCSWVQHLASV